MSRSHWPGSNEGPKERQVGSHQRQVASFQDCIVTDIMVLYKVKIVSERRNYILTGKGIFAISVILEKFTCELTCCVHISK